MADASQIQFFGLTELVGRTVTAWVAGLDCGDYVVDSVGSITVPMGSDPDGLLTAQYLYDLYSANSTTLYISAATASGVVLPISLTQGINIGSIVKGTNIAANSLVIGASDNLSLTLNNAITGALAVGDTISCGPFYPPWVYASIYVGGAAVPMTIPAVIGFPYASRGQTLRPAAESEIKSSRGSGLGKIRSVPEIAALLDKTAGISFGSDPNNLIAATLRGGGGAGGDSVPLATSALFSGVYRDTFQDDEAFDGEICWEITRPYPATVVSITGFVKLEER